MQNDPIRFSCPKCQTSVELSPAAAGKVWQCTTCSVKVRIPPRPTKNESSASGGTSAGQKQNVTPKQPAAPIASEPDLPDLFSDDQAGFSDQAGFPGPAAPTNVLSHGQPQAPASSLMPGPSPTANPGVYQAPQAAAQNYAAQPTSPVASPYAGAGQGPSTGHGAKQYSGPQPVLRGASWLSLLATPAGPLVLIGFLLPWISISCNNQKLDRASGFKMVLDAEAEEPNVPVGPNFDPTEVMPQGTMVTSMSDRQEGEEVLPFIWFAIPLLACGCLASVAALGATFLPKMPVQVGAAAVCMIGFAVTVFTGFYYGVYSEWRMEEEMAPARSAIGSGPSGMGPMAAEQQIAAQMASQFNITIDMDAGYYFTLATFIWSGLIITLSLALSLTRSLPTIIASVATGGIGLCIIFGVAIFGIVCLADSPTPPSF